MAVPVKRSVKKRAPVIPEHAAPSDILAAEIIHERIDLTPSVKRILDAGLGEAGRMAALTLFQEALSSQGNEMRDPIRAIEAARAVDVAVPVGSTPEASN